MPFKKNDEIELTIDDLGVSGEGIGHIDGYAVFVKGAIPGERVRALIMKVKKNYAYAKLVSIIKPSCDRVKPECEHAGRCGGCTLMHISYKRQLSYKEEKVKNCLVRIGGFDRDYIDAITEPIMGMDIPFHYRNKAQFPVSCDKNGGVRIGFYAERSHNIIDTDNCVIQSDISNDIVKKVRSWITRYHIYPYNELEHTGDVRHIITRIGYHTNQIMVCLVVTRKNVPMLNELVDILKKIPNMTSICLNINNERTNRIMGDKVISLYGPGYIEDMIGDVHFRISPLSFYQVNPIQTEKLYGTALEYAGISEDETVWDMYCGIGTISLFLAKKAGKVLGVEIVPEAIKDAKINAEINGTDNVTFVCGAAEDVAEAVTHDAAFSGLSSPSVVVLDPPRKGCDKSLIDTVINVAPKRVVYVSCDPATLARDLAAFREGGYELKRVRACDMFGMSGHVETVCLLSKLHSDQHIEVELKMDELDLTTAESKATYEEIKEYVLEHSGLKVSNLYIAQVKQKCGIIERANYNLPKSENSRQPKCPPEKEKVIRDALEHFRMI